MQEHDPLFDAEPNTTEDAPPAAALVVAPRRGPDPQALATATEAVERASKAIDAANRRLTAARIVYADAMAELATIEHPPCQGEDGSKPTFQDVRNQASRIEANIRARGEEQTNQRTHRPRAPMFGPRVAGA